MLSTGAGHGPCCLYNGFLALVVALVIGRLVGLSRFGCHSRTSLCTGAGPLNGPCRLRRHVAVIK